MTRFAVCKINTKISGSKKHFHLEEIDTFETETQAILYIIDRADLWKDYTILKHYFLAD